MTLLKKIIMFALAILMILASIQAAHAHNNVFINHNNTNWNLCNGASFEEWGNHYNVINFTLCTNTTLNITRFYNWTQGGYLIINATNINVSGNITGDGKGYAGGAGSGGGGGGVGAGGSGNYGIGGTGGTNWQGTSGCTSAISGSHSCDTYRGFAGTESRVNTGQVGGVANGYSGGAGIYFINSSGDISYQNGGIEGASGNSAPINFENSTAPNASIGGGGSGGGGGRGGNGNSGANDGGGAGGSGGAGQDGGAYILLIASQRITISNGANFNMRSGQNSCGERNGASGGAGGCSGNGGDGGLGGSAFSQGNCQAGSGGSLGSGCGAGANGIAGASGGSGAAGMIVAYAPNITISSGSIFNVTDNVGGGSIKILYKNNLTNSGTFSGYSNYLSSTYNNAPSITNVTITPSPATQANALTCNYSITDADGDSYAVSINWTVNNTPSTFHTATLGVGNFSNGQTVYCQVYATDSITPTSWISSNNLTLNDNTNPAINEVYASSYTPSSTDSVSFVANVTDSGSTVSATACKFQFQKSDFDGGNGLAIPFNYTTNTASGNLISRSINMATFGTGTLTWQYAHCFDDSMNKNTTSVNLNITITQSVASGGDGGGGGGGGGSDSGSKVCGLEIIKPATVQKTATVLCSPGNKIKPVDFVAYNTIGKETTFKFQTFYDGCTLEPDEMVVPGNERIPFTLYDCTCPTNDPEEFEVKIIQGDCSGNITVTMRPSYLASIISDPWSAFLGGLAILACIFTLTCMIVFIPRLLKKK